MRLGKIEAKGEGVAEDEIVRLNHQITGHETVNFRIWWSIKKPGMLQFIGSQKDMT